MNTVNIYTFYFVQSLIKCFSILYDEREVPFLSLLRDSPPLSPVDTELWFIFNLMCSLPPITVCREHSQVFEVRGK